MAENCNSPTGMREVKNCEFGGLEAAGRDGGGPQAAGYVATGEFGGKKVAGEITYGKRGGVMSNNYEGPKKRNGRQITGRR